MSTLVNMERSMKDCHDEDGMFNTERSLKESHDEDLMLAAEIGKSLLERNRELEVVLKATQEFAEEQCAQAEFYVKQVEILRDKNEESSRTCEQIEASNQMLLDKCEQWKADYKLLEGKNSRLWETINNLEKSVEELTSELGRVNENLAEIEKEKNTKEEAIDRGDIGLYNKINIVSDNRYLDNFPTTVRKLPSPCELENESLKQQISELNIQQKLRNLEKGEIESQLEDLINENQVLYHKIANLNQEITEWENFAQKEENYRRLAAAFTSKHFTEIEPDAGSATEKRIHEPLLPTSSLIKARSCESLNYFNLKNVDVLKSPNLVNNVLSSINSSSFLSELDTEYADLVKRYETLLDKFKKQEGKNPERTRKVQRAIQTLSMDFSLLTSPITPTKSDMQTSPMRDSSSCTTLNNTIDNENIEDYRKMFSDIFAKLKETTRL